MSEILKAIKQICDEKGLSYEAVIETVESALAAAYRKDFGKKNQNIKVIFDPETGKSKVYDVKTVVEDMPEEPEIDEEAEAEAETAAIAEVPVKKKTVKGKTSDGEPSSTSADAPSFAKATEGKEALADKETTDGEPSSAEATEGEEEKRKFNPKTEIQISDAKLIKKTAKIGDEIKTKLEVPESYGRMAAQTAKQVIIQRLREAERDMIFNDFKDKEHEVVSGVVQRREGRFVLVDLGKSVGVLPTEEQIPGEYYNSGDRIKVYVKEVASRAKGPEIILSRISDEILKKVFYLEIPEISNGLIEIKAVAREAGSRSKVAVWTDSDNVDPIGSCVGQRGARIQTIIKELGGEKVDIIEYNEDPTKFIGNALSPAKIISINLDENEKKAMVTVASDQLSLAIGKGGQNARLAARLTGWRIDIIESQEGKKVATEAVVDKADVGDVNIEETGQDMPAEAEETGQEKSADAEASEQSVE